MDPDKTRVLYIPYGCTISVDLWPRDSFRWEGHLGSLRRPVWRVRWWSPGGAQLPGEAATAATTAAGVPRPPAHHARQRHGQVGQAEAAQNQVNSASASPPLSFISYSYMSWNPDNDDSKSVTVTLIYNACFLNSGVLWDFLLRLYSAG